MDAMRRAGRWVDVFDVGVPIDASRREAQEEVELVKHRTERPVLQQQFVDLKRGLVTVTDENGPRGGQSHPKEKNGF